MTNCDLCGGTGEVGFDDPVTHRPASVLCPACTPEGMDLDPRVEDPEPEETPA